MQSGQVGRLGPAMMTLHLPTEKKATPPQEFEEENKQKAPEGSSALASHKEVGSTEIPWNVVVTHGGFRKNKTNSQICEDITDIE